MIPFFMFLLALFNMPRPVRKGDCATCREDPVEKVFKLNVQPGTYRFFKLLKK